MSLGLFPETEPAVQATKLQPGSSAHSPKERLLGTYQEILLEAPPVRSLSADTTPDIEERTRLARRLTAKDVPRLLSAVCRAHLEIVDAGRMANAKVLLADWLTACLDDAASGGNGSERVDVDALIERTRAFLEKGLSQ